MASPPPPQSQCNGRRMDAESVDTALRLALQMCAAHREKVQCRAVLNGKKKSVPEPVFQKTPAGTPCAQPWLVAVGGWWLVAVCGWQLATGGWWRLVVVGGGWWLVIGGWWRLAVVGSWRLVAAGGWRQLVAGGWWLAVGGGWRLMGVGGWRLVVPWGGPEGRSLAKKKKSGTLRTALVQCQLQ